MDELNPKEKPLNPELKKNTFSPPADYFNSLPDQIMHSIEKQELNNLAPLLFTIQKKEPFIAPSAYFETAPTLFCSDLQAKNSGFKISVWFKRFAWASLTVSLIFYFIFFPFNSTEEKINFSAISLEEYDQYLDENVIWLYTNDEINELLAFDQKTTTNTEYLEEYIVEEINLNELIEEF